jgi:hypothetical protein
MSIVIKELLPSRLREAVTCEVRINIHNLVRVYGAATTPDISQSRLSSSQTLFLPFDPERDTDTQSSIPYQDTLCVTRSTPTTRGFLAKLSEAIPTWE